MFPPKMNRKTNSNISAPQELSSEWSCLYVSTIVNLLPYATVGLASESIFLSTNQAAYIDIHGNHGKRMQTIPVCLKYVFVRKYKYVTTAILLCSHG
jgi:hypothetical protein